MTTSHRTSGDAEPTAPRRLLVVHAHPDDETLWTGGVIARHTAAGDRVTVVTCTLGEQGEVIAPELAGLAAEAADQLGGYRMGELAGALAALGVREHHWLGHAGRWRDSGMVIEPGGRASTPPDLHPRAFATDDPTELSAQVDELVAILRHARPDVVVTYGPDGGYGHPDHVRAHEITMAAVARVSSVRRLFWVGQADSAVRDGIARLARLDGMPFTVPTDLPSIPDADVTCTVDVTDVRDQVLTAIRAHATQVSVWDDGPDRVALALSNGVALPLPDAETFVLAVGDGAGAGTDLFGGLEPGATP